MNILVSGASGMIGRKICTFLSHQGHAIIPLKRGHVSASAFWDIDKQRVHIDDNRCYSGGAKNLQNHRPVTVQECLRFVHLRL